MKYFKYLGLITFLTIVSSAIADVPPLALQALNNTGVSDYENWAYTRELSNKSGDNRKERYNPSAKPSWQLVALNGQTPDKKHLNKYEKLKDRNTDYDHPGDLSYEGFIRLDSILLLKESEKDVEYSFLIHDKQDPIFSKHVRGIMTIEKNGSFPYVKRVVFRNVKPFSPQIGVKVKEFESIMELEPITKAGPIFVMKQTDKFEGRVMGVISINDVQVVKFNEFKLIEN